MQDKYEKEREEAEIIIKSILKEFANKKINLNVGIYALANIIQALCVKLEDNQIDLFFNQMKNNTKLMKESFNGKQ
jgi:hypothetical protein